MFRLSLVASAMLSLVLVSPVDAGIARFLPHRAPATKKVSKKNAARVQKDVQRLESILANVKTSTKLSGKSWQSAANEADSLASRIYVNVKSATTEKDPLSKADQLRKHVQQMKKAASTGDYQKSRRSADRALKVATQLDEWAG